MPTDPFLVVAGITVPVIASDASETEAQLGKLERAFDGTMRSTLRAVKRQWEVRLWRLTPAQFRTLRTAAPSGRPVAVSGRMVGGGDASPGAPIQCVPMWGSMPFVKRYPTDVDRQATLTLHEV